MNWSVENGREWPIFNYEILILTPLFNSEVEVCPQKQDQCGMLCLGKSTAPEVAPLFQPTFVYMLV